MSVSDSSLDSSTHRSLRMSILDGALFSFMVGVGETFIPAFVLALGLGDVAAGLLAVIPIVVGATLQLISPWAVQKLKSHKKWVLACAMTQALSFLPIIFMALYQKSSILILYTSTILYWTGGLGASAAWNTWMGKLVPSSIRTRYFARRTRICHLGILIGLITGGFVAQRLFTFDQVLLAFAIMFGLAMVARAISFYCLTQQNELPGTYESQEFMNPLLVFKEMASQKEGKIFKYLLFTQVVVFISSPFFAPFMLSQLELNYEQYMFLVCMAFLARVFVLPLISRYAGHFPATRLLKLGGLLIIPMPALWIVSNNYLYLIFIQILGGASWAIFELGITLSFFEGVEEKKRTSVLTCFTFANAVAMTVGTLIGAKILSLLGTNMHAYFVLFILSALARAIALFFLRGLSRSDIRLIVSRVLAVRPTIGLIDKPVVATKKPDELRSQKSP